jgi:glycosyl transferase family 25
MAAAHPQVFLINLDRHPDRLKHMSEALDGFGLPFERVKAFDGLKIDADEIRKWVPGPGTFRMLSPAEVGCFLSHRACWQRMLDLGLPAAVIFEDDVHFSDDAGAYLTDLDWVPPDADIVRAETWLSRSVIDRQPVVEVRARSVHRLRTVQYGLAAYIITRAGAEKALRLTETFRDTTDDFLFNTDTPYAQEFVTYQLFPAICVQDRRLNRRNMVFHSSIQTGPKVPRPNGVGLVWRELRRAFKKGTRPIRLALANVIGPRKWVYVPFE